MAVLDDLSGFEFEDVMEDVFRNLGYENVRQANRTADEGRDVIMEEVVDGRRRAIIVECKHTGTVGRPVVQKLHSAIATFDFDGPKRGMVVTTGRFTNPAKEYANRLQQNDDPHPIELLDVESVEIAEYTMHPVALFELLLHRKRLTARWRGKTHHRDWRRACKRSQS
jgi:hypothetical protein